MTGHDVVDLAKKFEDYGVEAIIYTDIGRDGMMTGINIEATVKLAQATQDPGHRLAAACTASPTSQALLRGARTKASIGAIAGRAIYEGKLDFKTAQAAADKAARRRPERGSRQAHHSLPRRRPPAASSRASTSSSCATPATRSRSRAATTSRAPTSSPSSTSPRASDEPRPDPAR